MLMYNTEIDASVSEDSSNKDIEDLHDNNERTAEIVPVGIVDIISQKVDKSLLTDVSLCENIRNESAAVYSETNRTSSYKIDESSCGNNNEGTAEIISSERVDITPDKNDNNLKTDENLRKDIRNESAAKTDCISSYRTVNESLFKNSCNEDTAEIISSERVDITPDKNDKNLKTDENLRKDIRNESAAKTDCISSYRTVNESLFKNSCNEDTAEIISSERVDITPDKNDKNLKTDENLRKDIRNESAAKTDCISSYRTVNESLFKNSCNEDTAEIVSSERVDVTPDKNDKNIKTDGNLREVICNETTAATQQRLYIHFLNTHRNTMIFPEYLGEIDSNKTSMNVLTNTTIDKDVHKSDPVPKNYGISDYLQTLDFVANGFEEKLDILITQITLKNELPTDLQHMLFLILGASNSKNIILHLIKSDFLQILLNTVDNRPNLTILILQIIINVCEDDEAIDLISNDKKFIQIIVNQLKSFCSVIALKVFKILEIIITYKIQKGHLNWFNKVKKSFKFLENHLLRILTSDNGQGISHDELPLTIMKVLKLITYDLNISLSQLFSNKMNDLIYALMSSVIKIQTNKDNNFGEICVGKFAFFENWLIIMNTVKGYFRTIFLNYENNQHFITLLRIIHNILKHYQQPNALSSKLERKMNQDYQIINQLIILLEHIRRDFYLPLVFDRVLANLTFSVFKIVVDLDLDEREANSEKILCKLLNSLKNHWLLCIVEHHNPLQIAEIIHPCVPKACKYLINLGLSSDITYKKMVMANVAYKNLTLSD
ncbi:unnamed protein product [Lasius platythorax]|uniref:Uncharacterized protein n=1 Tax=Lasius platythorax TaxID=488582 RepID=A0AAV2NYN9_9HYME